MAWLVPWEHARQERILPRHCIYGDQQQQRLAHRPAKRPRAAGSNSAPTTLLGYFDKHEEALSPSPANLCAARAMQLKLALRWYQADNGKPADNLDELVPKYLPSIPIDPYDGEPFRYRLSHGEARWRRCRPHKDSGGSGRLMERRRRTAYFMVLPPRGKMKASGGVYARRCEPAGHKPGRSARPAAR